MGFVNKIMLLGNLTRTPQLRTLNSGTVLCDFGLATNRVFKTPTGEDRQETVFVDCTAFGRTAEIIADYCPKGRQVFIEGRLHFESWDDAHGNRRTKLSVIVENLQLLGSRETTDSTPQTLYSEIESRQTPKPTPTDPTPPATKPKPLTRRKNTQPTPTTSTEEPVTAGTAPAAPSHHDDIPF